MAEHRPTPAANAAPLYEGARPTAYRSYMLAVLGAVYAFNFADRQVLGLLMQAIKTDLHLSDAQMGLLTGIAFALLYSVLGIPIARWADRGNRITIISLAIGVWSSLVICCGLVTSYSQLLLARIGVGVGEAGCVPPSQSLIADYYSRSERPRAMSYYLLGGQCSIVVGSVAAGWINQLYGWRWSFIAVGVPGIFLALLVRLSLHEPRLRQAGGRLAESSGVTGYWAAFVRLWRGAAYRHLLIGFTLIYFFSYGVGQWVPTFLIRAYRIDTGELGSWYALIWGIGGAAGTYLGGYLAARHASNNEVLQLKGMAVALSAFIPLYLGIYLSPSIHLALALMLVAAIIYCAMFGPLFAMLQEVVAPELRAMAVAIVLFSSNLLGMGLGPLAIGVMSDLLRPFLGDESLRCALLVWTPGYMWAVYHVLRAAKSVQRDIAASQGVPRQSLEER